MTTRRQRHQPAHWVGGLPKAKKSPISPDDEWHLTGVTLTPESKLMDAVHELIESGNIEDAEVGGWMLTAQDVYDCWWERVSPH